MSECLRTIRKPERLRISSFSSTRRDWRIIYVLKTIQIDFDDYHDVRQRLKIIVTYVHQSIEVFASMMMSLQTYLSDRRILRLKDEFSKRRNSQIRSKKLRENLFDCARAKNALRARRVTPFPPSISMNIRLSTCVCVRVCFLFVPQLRSKPGGIGRAWTVAKHRSRVYGGIIRLTETINCRQLRSSFADVIR